MGTGISALRRLKSTRARQIRRIPLGGSNIDAGHGAQAPDNPTSESNSRDGRQHTGAPASGGEYHRSSSGSSQSARIKSLIGRKTFRL